jgi:hypothetical protein
MILAYMDNLETHQAEQSLFLANVEIIPHIKPAAGQRSLSRWNRIVRERFAGMSQTGRSQHSPKVHKALLRMKGISVQSPKEK